MSHYTCYAVVPMEHEHPEKFIEEKLERYSENREVAPYERVCECIEGAAMTVAERLTAAKVGELSTFKDSFVNPLRGRKDLSDDEEAELEAAWREHTKPYRELEEKLRAEYVDRLKPEAKCEECHGTGKQRRTYNPESKWDWYRVGGRWDGYLTGESKRSDGGYNFHGHDGLNGNVAPVSYVLAEKKVPWAILTPDGEWHEKGKMGWWATSTGKKKGWPQAVSNILAPYADTHVVVAIDCHI